MLWLTWRQHRAQIAVTFGLLAVLGVMLLVTGLQAADYAARHAPPGCPGPAPVCQAVNEALRDWYDPMYMAFGLLPLAGPALVGAFWGAPLLGREYERGTNKLAWTQEVPLGRWLGYKIVTLAGLLVAGGLASAAMISTWTSVFRGAVYGSALSNPGEFNMVGVAPAAWWLFAFAVGTLAGTLFRRTLVAMAVTIAVLMPAFPLVFFAQKDFAEPVRLVTADRDQPIDQGGLFVTENWVDPAGRELTVTPVDVCVASEEVDMRSGRAQLERDRCLLDRGYRMAVYYHPANRFWPFQWTEAAILTAAAAALTSLAIARTSRRRI
ncbi:transporter [Sphaerisporangium siamense]|uniref:ABC transporter permease n=1 Tax=Sphaerisporangium siamense TaxID=795645 RepID=A0A7W7D6B6_9ACTN|nr:ABC transporter permease [Sphaerisporangium siamense]MBB4701083.1 hypothetical protein [Sphaerisporangium siamense]GII89377.1 transporter [Sphaerisporangium siamense]